MLEHTYLTESHKKYFEQLTKLADSNDPMHQVLSDIGKMQQWWSL